MKPLLVILGILILSAGLWVAGRRRRRSPTGPSDADLRKRMVETQIAARGIKNSTVLSTLQTVPRHLFVPDLPLEDAYADRPLPIGHNQTISQPYIVALLAELLALRPDSTVLEVGTGSGYQSAVLSKMARTIFTVEIIPELAEKAKKLLGTLGLSNIVSKIGDGSLGWPEKAPFDAIVVAAAPPQIPKPLMDQLADRGRLVLPVGPANNQNLLLVTRTQDGFKTQAVIPVRFVPMTGQAQRPLPQ